MAFSEALRTGQCLGSHVGKELAKAFIMTAPDVTQNCIRTNNDAGCAIFMLEGPVIGLLALVGIPPLVTATAGYPRRL